MTDSAADIRRRLLVGGGLSMMEIVQLWGASPAEVRKAMSDAMPNGMRNGVKTYSFKETARAMLAISDSNIEDEDVVERILKRYDNKLPPTLKKDFWVAQLSKQKFEQNSGDLWPTAQVIEYCGDAFKNIRLALQLLPDTIEREETLTERQRAVVTRLVDATLNDMRERLIDGFDKRRGAGSEGEGSSEEDSPDENL